MVETADKASGRILSPKQRLVVAAGKVFAEKGYHKATVRDICSRAGANVAAVNYHFSDKAALYRAVFEHAQSRTTGRILAVAKEDPQRSPEERFREYIHAHVHGLLADGPLAWFSNIVAWEMTHPSPLRDELFENEIRPRSSLLQSIVRELLGEHADSRTVRHCELSVVAQSFFHKQAQPVISLIHPDQSYEPDDIAALANHIYTFSLAGIRCLREQLERQAT